MISRITVTNFKCFVREELEFGGLNVFAGANGTGKSSMVQALLVLSQSIASGALGRDRLQLNGELIDLGTGRDVLYRRSDADRFGITVGHDGQKVAVVATVPPSTTAHMLEAAVDPHLGDQAGLGWKLLYLSADRFGPQKVYPINMADSTINEIGRRGEFAPLLYGRLRSSEVKNDALLLENSDNKVFPDLETQFGLWMERLFPGFQVRTDDVDQMDGVILGLNLQHQIGAPEFLRPFHVGYGVSVVLPVILAGLIANPKSVLVVETPEAHLHPSAQSLVGEFLGRVSAGGTQVFIETHSDHVVNGLRLAVRNGVLPAADVRFFAFSKTAEYGSSSVVPVRLESSGDFEARPDRFFDQADKDLKLIYGF